MEPKTLQENYVLYRDPSVCSVTLGMLEGGENKYKKQKTKGRRREKWGMYTRMGLNVDKNWNPVFQTCCGVKHTKIYYLIKQKYGVLTRN